MKRTNGLAAALVALFLLGPARSGHAQSSVIDSTLGFESPSAWQVAGGTGTLSSVAPLTQGTAALRMSGSGSRRIRSGGLVLGTVGTKLTLETALQSAAAGWETIGVVLEIPAANIYWQDLGTKSLSGAGAGQVKSFEWTLPAAVRTALGANKAVNINVVFNGNQAFVLDHLDVGLVPPALPPLPPTPPSSTSCQHDDLEVVDVQGDFRDIWAGREDVATGKRTDAFPEFTLRFNRAVETERISVYLAGLTTGTQDAPSDCLGGVSGHSLHSVPLSIEHVTGSWGVDLHDVAQRAPLDFNVVAFEDVSSIPDARGAVLAGRNVTLQNFSVNQGSQRPIGLVVGGTFRGTNGTIKGDLARGATAPVLQSVTLAGTQRLTLPIDIPELKARLGAASRSFLALGAPGSVTLNGTQLKLTGSDPALNVFALSAATLTQARTIQFATPSGASVLVNVRGDRVSVTNAQISLGNAARGAVLWNFAEAQALELKSVSFQGSALAPLAVATVNFGNFEGTLVARSVVGTMEFHDFPLTSWESFGGSNYSDTLTFKPLARLRAGCEYQLVIDPFPATPDGGCMAEGFIQPFLVEDGRQTAFDRDMEERRFQRKPNLPAFFTAKLGINTPVEDVFDRYADTFGFRSGLDELVPALSNAPYPGDPARDVRHFRQTFRGVPVDGYGYLVVEEGGLFRSAAGQWLPNLDISTTPARTEQQAITAALAKVNPATKPWLLNPPKAAAPRGELLLKPRSYDPKLPNVRLVWRVNFSGIPEAKYADVDATTGSVIFVQPGRAGITPCSGFNPATAVLDHQEERTVKVPFDSATSLDRTDLEVGIWKQGGSSQYESFNIKDPLPLRTRFAGDRPGLPRLTEFVCAGADEDTKNVAAAQWSIQDTNAMFLENFGWKGLRGPIELSPPALLVTVYDPTSPVATEFQYPDANQPDEIHVRANELFFSNLAHEYAHGVSLYTRADRVLASRELRAESGSLEEAYADIMASLSAQHAVPDGSFDPWCISVLGTGCDRDMRAPESSLAPLPDTYLGPRWKPIEDECVQSNHYCYIHENSTVVSHWFYTLVHGRSGTEVNDLGCSASVTPLSADPDEAMIDAGQIVFDAFSMLDPNAGFLAARAMTGQVAEDLYGAEAKFSVEKAWHAVGVGEGPTPLVMLPEDGATDVEPWLTMFSFSVGSDAGPWVVRYSKDPDFTSSTILSTATAVEIDGVRYAQTGWSLDAGTKYYWQAREGTDSATGWDKCNTFTASFTTSAKPVNLKVPAKVEDDGYYLTDNLGRVSWEPTRGATHYEALLLEDDGDDGCAHPADEWTKVFGKTVYLGNSFDQDDGLDPDLPVLGRELELDPDHTYHLFVRAMDLGREGTCNHFEVRKLKLLPFELLSPLHFDTIPYNSGGPFVFTPSEGAVRYEIVIECAPPSGGGFQEVRREVVDADSVVLDSDGNVEHTLGDKSVTTLQGECSWRVEAFHETGDSRRGWDPGRPFLTSHAHYWNAAEQIIQGTTDSGVHAPLSGNVVPVAVVFRSGDPWFTQTCLKIGPNVAGMQWWFGPGSYTSIPDSEIQFWEADPTSTEEYQFCTPEAFVEETMRLVVVPYSNVIRGNFYGFGEQTEFRMKVSDCGDVGDACCTSGDPCVDGALCNGTKCVDCGGANEPCCTGHRCDNSLLNCEGTTCRSCGKVNEPCCTSGTACSNGTTCDANKCSYCGGFQAECCSGSKCLTPNTTCSDDNRCTMGKSCNEQVYAGSNQFESFTVDMGKTSGHPTLWVNTLDVADEIVVKYQDQQVFTTGCWGTNSRAQKCDGGLGWTACCSGFGLCGIQFSYGPGTSTELTVEVTPNCEGTSDTLWEFKMSCP